MKVNADVWKEPTERPIDPDCVIITMSGDVIRLPRQFFSWSEYDEFPDEQWTTVDDAVKNLQTHTELQEQLNKIKAKLPNIYTILEIIEFEKKVKPEDLQSYFSVIQPFYEVILDIFEPMKLKDGTIPPTKYELHKMENTELQERSRELEQWMTRLILAVKSHTSQERCGQTCMTRVRHYQLQELVNIIEKMLTIPQPKDA